MTDNHTAPVTGTRDENEVNSNPSTSTSTGVENVADRIISPPKTTLSIKEAQSLLRDGSKDVILDFLDKWNDFLVVCRYLFDSLDEDSGVRQNVRSVFANVEGNTQTLYNVAAQFGINGASYNPTPPPPIELKVEGDIVYGDLARMIKDTEKALVNAVARHWAVVMQSADTIQNLPEGAPGRDAVLNIISNLSHYNASMENIVTPYRDNVAPDINAGIGEEVSSSPVPQRTITIEGLPS